MFLGEANKHYHVTLTRLPHGRQVVTLNCANLGELRNKMAAIRVVQPLGDIWQVEILEITTTMREMSLNEVDGHA